MNPDSTAGGLAPVVHLDDHRSALPPLPVVDPDQLWGEVMAAAQLFGALRQAGLTVRFDLGDPRRPPRVLVCDLEGQVVRVLPASVACDPQALEQQVLGGAA